MPDRPNAFVPAQPFEGPDGYEVLGPGGTLLGMIERCHVQDADGERADGAGQGRFRAVPCGGRPVVHARLDEVGGLAGFVPRERLDVWALYRARLAGIRRPIATFSDSARDLGQLIEDVRATVRENEHLSIGRVALIELAWQRMHTIHDPELAGVRLGDALRPGPDILRRG